WALEQGDIVQIIPGRNLHTLEANGLYILRFSSPISAFAYQGHVTRIAKLVAEQTPTSLYSGIPPQPGYILDGMDVHAAIEAYTLKPATQRLTLRQLKPPLSRAIAPQVRFGGHPALTQRPGKMPFELRLTLDGPQLALRRIRHVIYESGRARALSWSGGEEMNVPISEWVAPKRYGEPSSATGESTKSEMDGDVVPESEEAVEEEIEHRSEQDKPAELKRRKPHPVFVLGFHTEHAAQSFKRYWHRRPMEWEGDHADEEGDLPPIANVELLWIIQRVLALAITTDEYDCATAVENPVTGLLARYMQPNGVANMNIFDVSDLALAAYFFRISHHFTVFTSRLVKGFGQAYTVLLDRPIVQCLGVNILLQLESQRSDARHKYVTLVERLATAICTCGSSAKLVEFRTVAADKLFCVGLDSGFHVVHSAPLQALLFGIARAGKLTFATKCYHPTTKEASVYPS
ncbi:hypothetical protein LTR95_011279, partial [Oleoguttula sp. CCFEE 5521]